MPNVQLRDMIMYYEETGSGEPLVLIMGLGGDLQGWALQVPALAKHFRVITFDNRGSGRSSAPDRMYSISGMADDLAHLLDHLKIDRAHILGFSMGGYIAQEFVLKYPARVGKLILMATSASIDGYGRNILKGWINLRRSNMSREQTARLQATWLYGPDLLDDDALFERSILNSLSNPYPQQDHAFIRQAQALLQWEGGRAAAIKSPTLVIAGEDDVFFPARNTEKLAKAIPSATLATLPGGHVGAVEYPHEYNTAILEFLGALGAKQEAEAAAV